jgi:hypothetical protein
MSNVVQKFYNFVDFIRRNKQPLYKVINVIILAGEKKVIFADDSFNHFCFINTTHSNFTIAFNNGDMLPVTQQGNLTQLPFDIDWFPFHKVEIENLDMNNDLEITFVVALQIVNTIIDLIN